MFTPDSPHNDFIQNKIILNFKMHILSHFLIFFEGKPAVDFS